MGFILSIFIVGWQGKQSCKSRPKGPIVCVFSCGVNLLLALWGYVSIVSGAYTVHIYCGVQGELKIVLSKVKDCWVSLSVFYGVR